eukprot:GSChrysophyteH1.ASY1.ANO1.1557.1 assembled CDS
MNSAGDRNRRSELQTSFMRYEEVMVRVVKALTIIISIYLIWRKQGYFAIALLPIFFVDYLSSALNSLHALPISRVGARNRQSRPWPVKLLVVICFIFQVTFIISLALTRETILDELATISAEQVTQGITTMFLAPLAVKDESAALLQRITRQRFPGWAERSSNHAIELSEVSRKHSKHLHKVDRKQWQSENEHKGDAFATKMNRASGEILGNISKFSVITHSGAIRRQITSPDVALKKSVPHYPSLRNTSMGIQHRQSIVSTGIPQASRLLIARAIRRLLPISNHSDLRYRDSGEVRSNYKRVFDSLPRDGFRTDFKNPCWEPNFENSLADSSESRGNARNLLSCLPYVYILGQPKCGTTDLYARIAAHPHVFAPRRKEIRWFTRGEFTTEYLPREDIDTMGEDIIPEIPHKHKETMRLGNGTSISSFTQNFAGLVNDIAKQPLSRITIDGGPHTLWWPTQNANGDVDEADVPIPQILREMQPSAKFIITLSDPVNRMYSDYHHRYLENGNVEKSEKSAKEFHARALEQVENFRKCLHDNGSDIKRSLPKDEDVLGIWIRASQICIGMYSLFYLKWLEHFSPQSFLLMRLEDYDIDPLAYMNKVFRFLDLTELTEGDEPPEDWQLKVLKTSHLNMNTQRKEEMQTETRKLLEDFYAPYNQLLADLVSDEAFLWRGDSSVSNAHASDRIVFNDSTAASLHSTEIKTSISQTETLEENSKNVRPSLRGGKTFLLPQLTSIDATRAHPFSFWDLSERDQELTMSIYDSKLDNFYSEPDAKAQLCISAFWLDTGYLKFLLYDIGVPAYVLDNHHDATPWHCLVDVSLLADASPKSYIFSKLKGTKSWLDPHISPSLQRPSTTVLSSEIIMSLGPATVEVAKWLDRFSSPTYPYGPYMYDLSGNTAMHSAVRGGMFHLIEFILKKTSFHTADNIIEKFSHLTIDKKNTLNGRTPMHYAVNMGHTHIAALLKAYGASLDTEDKYGVTARSIMESPGPIAAKEALKYFDVNQRPPKKIERLLHPESEENIGTKGFWRAGNGGWNVQRIEGYESDISCDFDAYWAHEVSSNLIFKKYIAEGRPVLIRGLIENWPVVDMYKADILRANMNVQVAEIPYPTKFGASPRLDMTLKEFISEVMRHEKHASKVNNNTRPWYVFKGHPIPAISEDSRSSLVLYEDMTTPAVLQEAFEYLSKRAPAADSIHKRDSDDFQHGKVHELDKHSRSIFVNAQWALGDGGSGAPVHFHNTAWNALIYGAKKWVLYPPTHMMMSKEQIYDFFQGGMNEIKKKPRIQPRPSMCVQTAGDVMIVPESWAHGVLNIQQSVAVATEIKAALWRPSSSKCIHKVPPS